MNVKIENGSVIRRVSYIALIISVLCGYSFVADASVIDKVRQNYSKNSTIKLQFDLSTFWSVREKNEIKTGSLILAPKDRFRVELGDDVYISNGDKYWQYNRKVSQVTIEKVRNIDVSSLPSGLLRQFLSNYTFVEKAKNGSLIQLEWVRDPADQSSYTAIKLWVDNKGIISKLEATDRNSNINTYTFRKTIFGSEVSSGTFEFKIPKNAQVLNNYE